RPNRSASSNASFIKKENSDQVWLSKDEWPSTHPFPSFFPLHISSRCQTYPIDPPPTQFSLCLHFPPSPASPLSLVFFLSFLSFLFHFHFHLPLPSSALLRPLPLRRRHLATALDPSQLLPSMPLRLTRVGHANRTEQPFQSG